MNFIEVNLNSEFLQNLFDSYPKFFESILSSKRFVHKDILNLIKQAEKKNCFDINVIGKSIEQREIFSIQYGEGKTKVLLWSQMHGDEPTATMALFDLLNFLSSQDEFDEFRNSLKKNLKLIIVPMLNPDGSERITRQNAIGIDLNRDAKKMQSPESKILIDLIENYKPDFAFNLHDQDFRWSVGNTNKLAAISLLAPVYDYEKSIDSSRLNAIKLVADLRIQFEKYLPSQISRYKDDYEPRSFGDLIAGKNVSTILIESGRDIDDVNKFFYRKINYLMYLWSFNQIFNDEYKNRNEADYFEIPTNGNFMFDLILRNVNFQMNGNKYQIDIAINREEVYGENSRIPYLKSAIMDIGDLSIFYGIEEFDCTGLDFEEGKSSEEVFSIIKEIDLNQIKSLLQKGILFVKMSEQINETCCVSFPINIISKSSNYIPKTELNSTANFCLTKNGKVEKLVINGWLCNMENLENIKNGLVF